MTTRLRRSALFLPASNARAIAKARTLDCDVVVLDLEDAVAPDLKEVARDQALGAAREGGFGQRMLVLRVNGLDTAWAADDCSSAPAPSASVTSESSRAQCRARLQAATARSVWVRMASFSRRLFLQSIRELVPAIRDDDIVRGGSGVRAQAIDPTGKLLDDFHIVRSPRART